MSNKFSEYYSTEERIGELSEYVHQNFKLIYTKMISEMRQKLNITPDLENSDGYVSLMMSIQGRLFNEMVYSMAGSLQSSNMTLLQVLPPTTLLMILDLMMGINPLQGLQRGDVKNYLEAFKRYYSDNINQLRKSIEALPK
jgi:hypothetical protein